MRRMNDAGLRRSGWLRRSERGPIRERGMVTIAAALALILAANLGMLGSAQADTPDVIEETREENLDVAAEALPVETPEASAELTNSAPEEESLKRITLPDDLPTGATIEVDVADTEEAGAPAPIDLGGMDVTVAAVADDVSPERVGLTVLDQAATEELGLTGVLIEVADASPTPATGDQSVALTVSYADFAGAAGGDWATRLQTTWVPDCGEESEPGTECAPSPLASTVNEEQQTITVDVPVAAGETGAAPAMLGATVSSGGAPSGGVAIGAGVAGKLGNWSATSMALSSTWGTSGATGAFTWAYPMRAPQVPAGPAPELSLSYNSAVSDGRIPSTNNQSGLIGEGFDIGASYIERSYESCADDESAGANNKKPSSPDLCWGKENATLSLNGAGSELIKDKGDETWHPRKDDGTRVEHLTSGGAEGEYWKVTTTDGTQYLFGSDAAAKSAWTVPVYGNHDGEPGYETEFVDSDRPQVWRWNLDRVIDPSGNTASYFYTTESNRYTPYYETAAPATYTAGGYLKRVEYGMHPDDGVLDAPAKVEFNHAPRCIHDLAAPNSWCAEDETSTKANAWPDTPIDLVCTAGATCKSNAPTFFNRTRLASVTTSVNDGSAYQPVDTWTLSQRFVPPGTGTGLTTAGGIMLRLDAVTHSGNGGTREKVTLPAVRFDYYPAKNRVEAPDTGATALWRQRVNAIGTESGGVISVNYTTSCTKGPTDSPDNHSLCFPVKWQDPNEPAPRTDWFYKYVVSSVIEGISGADKPSDLLVTGSGTVTTTYDYTVVDAEGEAKADWKWVKPDTPLIDAADKMYSEFRGASQVTTTKGIESAKSSTVTTYYRGSGAELANPIDPSTPVTDWNRLAGEVFTTTTYNGAPGPDTPKLSETVNTFGTPDVVAESTLAESYTSTRIPSQTVDIVTYTGTGAKQHHTRTSTSYNEYSQPTKVDDQGDTATADDDLCTTTTYAHAANPALEEKHLVALPNEAKTVSTKCASTPVLPADMVAASKLTYDALGRPTKTDTIDPTDGTGYVDVSTTEYDSRGRVVKSTDAAGQVTSTKYVESDGGVNIKTETKNPLTHTMTTEFDPFLGVPLKSTDANTRVTSAKYDALGRLTTVIYPQHTEDKPSVTYAYTVEPNGLNAVVTKTLSADGLRYHASSVLYDGLLRPFQTQEPGRATGLGSAGQGRLVTQTKYDSAGRVIKQTEPWSVTGDPSAKPEVAPSDTSGHTTYEYDAAGRQTAKVFWIHTDANGTHEQWRTTTVYDGATTLHIPPLGTTPTATTVDARGRTTSLTQYHRDPETDTQKPIDELTHTTTKYEYYPSGQLKQMTDPRTNKWSYGYDYAGRQTSASDPDAGETTTSYDQLGRVLTRENANGQILAYTYDALGRTTSLRDGSATGPIRATWEYDTKLNGMLTSSTRYKDGQPYITRTDVWDAAYRPTQMSIVLPNTGAFTKLQNRTLTTKVEYTSDGQTSAITYPAVTGADGSTALGQEKVTTIYDAPSSMPSWMSGGFGWGTYVAASKFASDGRPLLADLGNTYGAVVAYLYQDGTKRLSGISLDRQLINGTELNLNYAYDPAGNVTSIKDAPTSANLKPAQFQDNQCFNYDGLIRVENAWTPASGDCKQTPSAGAMGGAAPYWTKYAHDVLGNRTTQINTAATGTATTTSYTHGEGAAGPHAVTTATTGSATPTTYGYDEAGNRTSRKLNNVTTGYLWDAEGELTTVGDTSNVYDASGNRIVRTDANGTTVYAGGQEIQIAATTNKVTATRYYSFAGQTVAVRTDRGLGNGVTSLVNDHHGTPVAAIPNGGHPAKTAVTRLYTDPFGATRGASNAATVPGDTQFLGKTRDQSTGLTLLGARYYDEATGRFISVDPVLDLTDPQQWNAYAYSGNNPLTFSDASGLLPVGPTDNSTYNPQTGQVTYGTNNSSSADAIVSAPPPKTVDPPASPDFWSDPWGWVDHNQAEIIGGVSGVVVGTLVTGACLAATAGAGSVGCLIAGGAAGGAVGGAITNLWKTQVTRTQQFDWGTLALDTGMGLVLGAAGGAAGGAVAQVAAKVAASTASPAVRAGANAVSCAVNSFVPGTAVLLADGSTVPIENVELGDEVLATDPETGQTASKPVTALITGAGEKDLTTISIAAQGGDGAGTVVATDGHPFWVPEIGRWVDAGDLLPGDWLSTSAGTLVQVTAVAHDHREQAVHNLTVADTHTYYVAAGADAVLVHNCGGAGDTIDLFRAVGVKEYDGVMSTGRFEPGGVSMNARQFALTIDEAISYANTDTSKVAILRATVDRSAVEGVADFSTSIDPWIFRNGVYTVQPGIQSDIFHAGLKGVGHAF
ncbi:hypothetical protein GCM10009747_04780 [Agromyces humatus]|uniref:Teneurin-like YD-shell domain-containing protein n=2 Tax=Agromyces humatus TaxID=279573 RepID=A0ABN2K8G8_9MICO